MNPEDYVSYPLALALKKAGFDYPCYFYYTRKDSPDDHVWSTTSEEAPIDYNRSVYAGCSMPTLAQAQKWLREKRGCCVSVYAQPYNGLPYYTGYILYEGDEKKVLDQDGHWFDNYEKALSETIAAALELIEKKGE